VKHIRLRDVAEHLVEIADDSTADRPDDGAAELVLGEACVSGIVIFDVEKTEIKAEHGAHADRRDQNDVDLM